MTYNHVMCNITKFIEALDESGHLNLYSVDNYLYDFEKIDDRTALTVLGNVFADGTDMFDSLELYLADYYINMSDEQIEEIAADVTIGELWQNIKPYIIAQIENALDSWGLDPEQLSRDIEAWFIVSERFYNAAVELNMVAFEDYGHYIWGAESYNGQINTVITHMFKDE